MRHTGWARKGEGAKNELTEDAFIIDLLDAEPHASRKRTHQNVQVEEEGRPRGRLMFRHGGDDGDVNLGVARVP